VGRSRELSQLIAAVVARRGAVITGPAGVGKTTLAMTCLQQAQARGMSLARITATHASRALPFGAFASILPPDQGGDGLSRQDHPELLRRYARALAKGADGRPLVVFVDDAHLLDNGSATLVHQLALTQAATVLATVRSGESAPDPILSLWKDGPAERIEVGLLDEPSIEELLVAVLGGPVDAASVRLLVDRCQGNPLFLRELVTGALETGTLVDEGGIWRLRAGLRPTARLVELVALRLGDLSGPERAVLELLALGEPLEQAELDRSSVGRGSRAQGPDRQQGRGTPGPGVAGAPGLRGRGAGGDKRPSRAGHRPVPGRGHRGDRRAPPRRHPPAGLAASRRRWRQR
jgi:hypothetical protein